MSLGSLLALHHGVVGWLAGVFPADDLAAADTLDEFHCTTRVDVDAMRGVFSPASGGRARVLDALGYEFTLQVTSGNGAGRLIASRTRRGWAVRVEQPWTAGGDPPTGAPGTAHARVRSFFNQDGHLLADVLAAVEAAAQAGLPVDLELTVHLDKDHAAEGIRKAANGADASVHLILQPNRLRHLLATSTLSDLDERWFEPGERTAVVVPGLEGLIRTPYLTICGGAPAPGTTPEEHAGQVSAALERLDPAAAKAAHAIRDFFAEHVVVGDWQPKWITPSTFAVTSAATSPQDPAARLLEQELVAIRAQLAILFLADRVDDAAGAAPRAQFRGQRNMLVTADRDGARAHAHQAAGLIKLYDFVYDERVMRHLDPDAVIAGPSNDKLIIVRRALVLAMRRGSLGEVFGRATDVLATSEQSHENYVAGRVRDYLEARRQTRDYVRATVAETEASTTKLTSDLVGHVYKTAGLVVAAVVAALLDSGVSFWAAFAAAGLLVAYLGIVLSMQSSTHPDRRARYRAGIRGFEDILGSTLTEELLDDEGVRHAFHEHHRMVKRSLLLYAGLFELACVAAVVMLVPAVVLLAAALLG